MLQISDFVVVIRVVTATIAILLVIVVIDILIWVQIGVALADVLDELLKFEFFSWAS